MNVEPQVAQDGEQLRVIVVDDHALFRHALRGALELGGFDVCADVELGEQALAATLEHKPHVVLMDQRLPDLSGPAATRLILAEAPLFEAGVLYPYKVLRPLRLHRMEHFAIMSLLTRPQQGW